MVLIGSLLYYQYTQKLKQTMLDQNNQIVNQIHLNIYNYVRNMMRISDSMYYDVIKNADLSQENLSKEMYLLYNTNKDFLNSVACFDDDGNMISAAPVGNLKNNVDIKNQLWFTEASSDMQKIHFSTPHVQNLFEPRNFGYNWVVSLSRIVQLNRNGHTSRGVLLVDMNFSGLEQIFSQINNKGAGYMYLMSSNGEIIYHPHQNLIYSDLYEENNLATSSHPDGSYEEVFDGVQRQVIVKTVGYTGWKIVSIIPNSEFSIDFLQMRHIAVAIIGFSIFLLIMANSFVSSRIADPIKRLDRSVKDLEKGNLDLEVYIGGSYEVEHLGTTIKSMVEQMRRLMDDIVYEQEEKRKSEFNALQAQINPHFLYNALDSIVWMIESERYKEAIAMITSLASLFRISLSKGQTIISIDAELKHADNYLFIQQIRYKNKFTVEKNIDPQILNFTTIKLTLQPILENAIYHAMEMMDDEGELTINGYIKNEKIILEVVDNGLGMTQELVDSLLKDNKRTENKKRGSGIALINVHKRIQLYYGSDFGLQIESELDVGTTVRIVLPKQIP